MNDFERGAGRFLPSARTQALYTFFSAIALSRRFLSRGESFRNFESDVDSFVCFQLLIHLRAADVRSVVGREFAVFCNADGFFNSGFLCTRQLWRNVVVFDAATHSFRCGVCAYQELGMSVAQANGQRQWRQASGMVSDSARRQHQSRGDRKSRPAETVGKDSPDIGEHSNMLQTRHGARDAHAPVVQEKPKRRATEAQILQVRPGPSLVYLGIS